MPDPTQKVVHALKTEIEGRIKELLETKHLYQSVRVDDSVVAQSLAQIENDPNVIKEIRESSRGSYDERATIVSNHKQSMFLASRRILDEEWPFITEHCDTQVKPDLPGRATPFLLPTISVTCEKCDAVIPPHNSGFRGQKINSDAVTSVTEKSGERVLQQTFMFPYQCQACKGEPLVFLVRREGLKLTLVGRNHFEVPQVPKTIPKEETNYFGDAVVAFNTGSALAGLFLLRTTIEQYMRRVLDTREKLTGDVLADQYAQRLAADFPKERYPSLKTIYDELSACLHAADANETQFVKARTDIEKHFALLEHFPLKPKS